ncbi:WhiB family transcriptional regulator [Williamsia sterculiae]|uniref:Transcriptional regulator WhiB n=1 Tax=Williamsia sterculiae TaxID=1344003 RepID=A0A1N7H5N4_9NOCA|nr:WhiB family transcriptional regulator [Williamsia sterculiae]SIS20083.1 WhiB family transcriptional regulator, redox-sensing transcriptional regulator [Williamsia sterculiae]
MDGYRPDQAHVDDISEWNWQVRGRCCGADVDPELFFEPIGRESSAARRRREEQATSVCRDCPVLRQCREHAVRAGERWGVWGGSSAAELTRTVARSA